MTHRSAGLVAGLLTLLVSAGPAAAAPTTVDLRVEGATRTLYEGPVTTDVRTFRFTGDPAGREYPCDGTAANQGTSPVPAPTRGAALAQAAETAGFDLTGTWFASLASPSFSSIAGEATAYDTATNAYLVEYKNGETSSVGACGDPVAPGDRVLFAYGTGTEPLLVLTGPAVAQPGQTVELRVTNASDGQPVAGATVEGQTSGTDGRVRVAVGSAGSTEFKARKTGAIRSNRVSVCVSDGQSGSCGTAAAGQPGAGAPPAGGTVGPGGSGVSPTRDAVAPAARLTGIREQQRFRRARAPRALRGTVADDPSGLLTVKLRITRRDRGRCAYYSGRRERFVRTRCGRSFFFAIGADRSFSYLLPERLRRGRYVVDVVAVDRAGNRDTLARGRNRVVFTVR